MTSEIIEYIINKINTEINPTNPVYTIKDFKNIDNENPSQNCDIFIVEKNYNDSSKPFVWCGEYENGTFYACKIFTGIGRQVAVDDDNILGYVYERKPVLSSTVVQQTKSAEQLQPKMYILCNRRLAPIYAAVQGGHALSQWILEHPGKFDLNTTLVYISCRTDLKLQEMIEHGYDYSAFKEPDLGNTVTAIACLGDKDLLFTRLKTLS